jgi:predicted transglutaminase-like protease
MVFFEGPFVPTREDIENNEVKKLAKILKGNSIKETLTKIVEWQERNLTYWIDRADMFILLYILLVISLFILPIQQNVKFIFIIIIIFLALIDLASILPYFIILLSFLVVFFTLIFSVGFPTINNIYTIYHLVAGSFILGGLVFLNIYLLMKYRNLKSIQPEFKLGDTFKLSLPVEKILKYRLAICRDYAKLTAALLLNIYPRNKIYFITFNFPGHSATAIEYKNKIYVLDQRLPIMTLEKWLMFWKEKLNKKKIKAEILEIVVDDKKVKTKKSDYKKLDFTKIPKVDIKDLENKLLNSLRISQTLRKSKPDLKIPFKNLAISHEKDEIIIFSIMKTIENKIKNEFCEKLDKISRIEIMQNKKDILLKLWIK